MTKKRGDVIMLKRIILYFTIIMLFPAFAMASGKWEVIRDSELRVTISYIKFFDEKTGVAYGYGDRIGYVLTTNDGGQTWTKRKDIYGTGEFISPKDGIFISTPNLLQNSFVYHTEDGASTWKTLKVKDDADHLIGAWGNPQFISHEEGWAIGEPDLIMAASILHTNDGGVTWDPQLTLGNGIAGDFVFLYDIFFLDSKTGWAVGSIYNQSGTYCLVVGTDDGGENWWQSKWKSNTSGFRKIIFTTRKIGWALGFGGGIYYSSDGGKTWELRLDKYSCNMCFLNEMQGWIISLDIVPHKYYLLHTLDGGKMWDEKPINTPNNLDPSGISFINEREGWTGGDSCLIMHTKDGGETWENQTKYGYNGFQAVDFVSPGWGIAIGYYEILGTNDGLNWEKKNWADKIGAYFLYHIDFVDEQTGWLEGTTANSLSIWKTDDGGESWTTVSTDNTPLRDMCFVNKERGYMIRENEGNVYRTDDGGKTLKLSLAANKDDPFFSQLSKLTFIDENNGWAINMKGFVYRTKDGGTIWKPVGNIEFEVPKGIVFANENEGWAMNYVNGVNSIYHTEDGGANWHLDLKVNNTYLSDICYDGGEHVYAVGSYGIIVRYTDPKLMEGKFAVESEGKKETFWGEIKREYSDIPETTSIYQNYPNPFNPETWIPYQLKENADVIIRIYSSNGQLVRTLNLGNKPAGFYLSKEKSAYWDGRDSYGNKVASGIYFYTFDKFKGTKKMIVME